jgi:hypothetical protein
VEGGHRHAVAHDVVRVAIAAVLVVRDDDLGLQLTEDADQALHRLVAIGIAEGLGVLVRRPTLHPGIAVAQHPQLAHSQNLGGRL